MRSFLVWATLVFSLGGCEDTTETEPTIPEWTLERELTIGSMDGPDDALTRIGSIALGSNGDVLITQPSERIIRIFDRNGEFRADFAGEGEGPGEFRSLGILKRLADTLYLTDFQQQRTSMFSGEGAFLYSFQFSSPNLREGLWLANPTWLLADGTALGMPGYFSPAAADGTVTEIPILRITRSGEVLDTVVTYPLYTRPFAWTEGMGSYASESPFSDNPKVEFSPGRAELMIVDAPAPISAEPDEYLISWLSLDGDTVDVWEIPYAPIQIPQSTRDSVIDRAVERVTRGPNPLIQSRRAARTGFESAWDLPEYYPPVTEVVLAEDRRVWVRREDLSGPSVWWDLLSSEGAIAARLRLPSELAVRESSASTVWATETDELGVNYLVRFKIQNHDHPDGG